MNTLKPSNQPESRIPTTYLSTSIPYVNAQPHIGFALEAIQADTLARYHRRLGHHLWSQTGTDENSLKNVQAAEQLGIPTAQLVAQNAQCFQALKETLNLSFDDFIRTGAEARHKEGVHRLWQACAARGDIYKRRYRGLYCVGCERFYDEHELVDGKCPDHENPLEVVEEENYFFRLSHYQDDLLRLIESDQLCIVPESRKNEMLNFIRRGLHDFSISRSQSRARGWGIPVPGEGPGEVPGKVLGDESQVIYVWFDALANYITAPGYATNGDAYQRYWLDSDQRIHLIGKDITRFHAIYWPAMLLSAGLPLPTKILVHGFITVNGRKISKSLGNVIDPTPLVDRYGRDALRYYLLRKIPTTGDGDYTHDEFARTYTADLADQLGNLLSRVLKMIVQYCAGTVPAAGTLNEVDRELIDLASDVAGQVDCEVAQFALHKALAAIWTLVDASNKYVVATEPWRLARQGEDERLATTLAVLAESLRVLSELLTPFLPHTSQEIANRLGVNLSTDGAWSTACVWQWQAVGATVKLGASLFPKG